MKTLLLATAIAAAAIMPAHAAGDLEIQLLRGSLEDGSIETLVAVKNSTDTDFASMTWTCEFQDGDRRKVGGGPALFNIVPKGTVTADTLSFYSTATDINALTVSCTLESVEPRSRDNERSYRGTATQAIVPIAQAAGSDLWHDNARPNGVATPEKIQRLYETR